MHDVHRTHHTATDRGHSRVIRLRVLVGRLTRIVDRHLSRSERRVQVVVRRCRREVALRDIRLTVRILDRAHVTSARGEGVALLTHHAALHRHRRLQSPLRVQHRIVLGIELGILHGLHRRRTVVRIIEPGQDVLACQILFRIVHARGDTAHPRRGELSTVDDLTAHVALDHVRAPHETAGIEERSDGLAAAAQIGEPVTTADIRQRPARDPFQARVEVRGAGDVVAVEVQILIDHVVDRQCRTANARRGLRRRLSVLGIPRDDCVLGDVQARVDRPGLEVDEGRCHDLGRTTLVSVAHNLRHAVQRRGVEHTEDRYADDHEHDADAQLLELLVALLWIPLALAQQDEQDEQQQHQGDGHHEAQTQTPLVEHAEE